MPWPKSSIIRNRLARRRAAASPGERTWPLERADQQRDEERDERQRRGDELMRVTVDASSPTASAAAPTATCPGSRRRSARDRARRRPRAGRRRKSSVGAQRPRRTPARASHLPITTSLAVTGAVSSGSMVPLRSSSADEAHRQHRRQQRQRDPEQHRAAEDELHHAAGRRIGARQELHEHPEHEPLQRQEQRQHRPARGRAEVGCRTRGGSDDARIALTTTSPCANTSSSEAAAQLRAQRRRRAGRLHPPAVEDDDPARERLHVRQDVRRQQHRALAAQLPDQRVRLADLVRIQADRRLVEDQDRRPGEQRVRQADPLPVAARQRADDLRAPITEAGDADGVVDRRPPLAARDRP